jgi:hypothetical protein
VSLPDRDCRRCTHFPGALFEPCLVSKHHVATISGPCTMFKAKAKKRKARPQVQVIIDEVLASAVLPTSAADRKNIPMVRGLLDYFPAALAAVAAVSKKGNDQHNAGQPMHHARGKSTDHADCIVRHLVERGTVDTDGERHSAKVAWRALALLQEELEREAGAPLPRGAKVEAVPAGTVTP